ncbi:MAG: HD family hydrolase [Anaerolineales bacterium]|nr:HD family hydrolase [Anaerolineales bacterium]
METTAVLNLLIHGNQLKRSVRNGWVQRGVPNAENVAAHSYGVVFIALTLAQIIEVVVDLEKVLIMAALHDLPEGLTTDIPTPAWRYLPTGIKTEVERGAMQEIMSEVSFAPKMFAVWEELHVSETAESLLVHDADKLDMFIQAHMYAQQTGNRQLEEFWTIPYKFHYPQAQAIYNLLRAQQV